MIIEAANMDLKQARDKNNNLLDAKLSNVVPEGDATIELEYMPEVESIVPLKKDIINIDNFVTIFINFSQQSNGYSNFLKDKNILHKCIKIYFLKRSGINYFIGPLYIDENKINKIYSVIGHMTFDYYTDYFEVINNYIETNSISNYLIYY